VRVFLDTNVLVSGFSTRGLSADVVRVVMVEHELLTGEIVIVETLRVLSKKFGVPARDVRDIERLLRRFPVQPIPEQAPPIEVRDPDDALVLASALAAAADVLVTGDKDLLDIRDKVIELTITDPRGFWAMIRRR
jgi:putative PIN family toxin of toxin-antitoxin system